MALAHYLYDSMPQNESSMDEWTTSSTGISRSEENLSGGFECNICLDTVQDPVVTLCGHLYCWPCIYRWLHLQSISAQNADQQPSQCPVCKADVSLNTLVPLYGRGQNTNLSAAKKAPHLDMAIPHRPSGPASGADTPRSPRSSSSPYSTRLRNVSHLHQPQPYTPHLGPHNDLSFSSPGGTTSNVISVYGGMIYARMFGNSVTNLYTYPNSYNLYDGLSPRMRRQIMQADKSLGRISFFFFCCVLLCLLTF